MLLNPCSCIWGEEQPPPPLPGERRRPQANGKVIKSFKLSFFGCCLIIFVFKIRMSTFINLKIKKSDDKTNIDKNRVDVNIRECLIIFQN